MKNYHPNVGSDSSLKMTLAITNELLRTATGWEIGVKRRSVVLRICWKFPTCAKKTWSGLVVCPKKGTNFREEWHIWVGPFVLLVGRKGPFALGVFWWFFRGDSAPANPKWWGWGWWGAISLLYLMMHINATSQRLGNKNDKSKKTLAKAGPKSPKATGSTKTKTRPKRKNDMQFHRTPTERLPSLVDLGLGFKLTLSRVITRTHKNESQVVEIARGCLTDGSPASCGRLPSFGKPPVLVPGCGKLTKNWQKKGTLLFRLYTERVLGRWSSES